MQRPAQRLGEGLVGDRLRRGRVDRPAPLVVTVERREIQVDQIVPVDPGHVLAPGGHGPSDAELEEREHPSRAPRPAGRARGPGSGARTTRIPSSPAADASRSHTTQTRARKSSPAGWSSSSTLVAVRPVLADRRGGDQRAPGAASAARSPSTRLRVPCSRDCMIRRLTSWVQRWPTSSAARWTTPSRPASASAGAGSASGRQAKASTPQRALGALGIARQDRHLVAARLRLLDELSCRSAPSPPSPSPASRHLRVAWSSRGGTARGVRSGSPGTPRCRRRRSRTSRPRRRPRRCAAPRWATASATAGATSRLNGEGMT